MDPRTNWYWKSLCWSWFTNWNRETAELSSFRLPMPITTRYYRNLRTFLTWWIVSLRTRTRGFWKPPSLWKSNHVLLNKRRHGRCLQISPALESRQKLNPINLQKVDRRQCSLRFSSTDESRLICLSTEHTYACYPYRTIVASRAFYACVDSRFLSSFCTLYCSLFWILLVTTLNLSARVVKNIVVKLT